MSADRILFRPNVPSDVRELVSRWLSAEHGQVPKTQSEIDVLKRLVEDERMDRVYPLILAHYDHDGFRVKEFVRSAWRAATLNLDRITQEMARSRALSKAAAKECRNTAVALRRMEGTAYAPLISIRSLLWEAKNRADHHGWDHAKEQLLGRTALGGGGASEEGHQADNLPNLRSEALEVRWVEPDESVTRRLELIYSWGRAPSVAELLDTLADMLVDFSPEGTDWREEAASFRITKRPQAYLRALFKLLELEKVAGLEAALAETANVALDLNAKIDEQEVRRLHRQTMARKKSGSSF